VSGTPNLANYCDACQAVPRHGYCKLAGCPKAPSDTPASAAKGEAVPVGYACSRELRTRGPREETITFRSKSDAYCDTPLYAQPHPSQQADPVPAEWTGQGTDADFFVAPETGFSRASQQAGTEGAYAVAEAERDHWLKEAMRHKRPGRRSLHEQSDLDRARIAQRIMDKIATLNPSEAKG